MSWESAVSARGRRSAYLSRHDTLSLFVVHLGDGPSITCSNISQDLQIFILDQVQSLLVELLLALSFLGYTARRAITLSRE